MEIKVYPLDGLYYLHNLLKKCKSSNLLLSEDVMSTLNCLKKLGVKIKISKNFCEITGLGLKWI